MITVKKRPSKKDLVEINNTLYKLKDYNRDFYITKDNIRLFIKDNFDVVLKDLGRGDIIAWSNEAIALIVGFADKSPRKYLKVLAENFKALDDILKVLLKWNFPYLNLFCKMKKKNEYIPILRKYGFEVVGNRGYELLLRRRGRKWKS